MLPLNKMKPCKSHPHTAPTHPERPHHVLGSLLSAMAMSPTKKHVKNVHGRGAMEPTATILQGLLSSLVIQFTFLFITEDLICLSNFLELHACALCVCVCVCGGGPLQQRAGLGHRHERPGRAPRVRERGSSRCQRRRRERSRRRGRSLVTPRRVLARPTVRQPKSRPWALEYCREPPALQGFAWIR